MADVHKIMDQIFSKHVEKKEISGKIIKHAFKIYIEQFDPQHIYLLQGEVQPYLDPKDGDLLKIVAEYKADNYEAFENLNRLFQKAILRARAIRADLEKKEAAQLLASKDPVAAPTAGYPATESELKENIRGELSRYFQAEKKKYGDSPAKAFGYYEKQSQAFENHYLYVHEDGSPFTAQEQENAFVLHVLKALAKSLDAHTEVFDPEEAFDMRVRLEKGFDGVGIVFNETPQGPIVAHLVENGPAAKQGEIQPGDLLSSVNGKEIQNEPFETVMELLKGAKGQTVELGWVRNKNGQSKKFTVVLKRDTIVLDKDRVEVSKEKFGNGEIGRIVLHSFYQNDKGVNSEEDVKNAIAKLQEEGNLRGLILDLRDNSGGFLSQAVKVAGLFITNGVIVISKYSNGDEKIYRDMDGKVAYDGPLVILTSKATASAAEIVAQAIQDYGVGVVVGDEQTYGKGTIQSQTVTENKGSSLFKVTVGKYYTVSGKTPQIQGVKADVVVPGPYASLKFGEENLEYTIKGDDKIPSAYADKLQDIDPHLRPWYFKYYMPTLQHKSNRWRGQIPILQKNSSYRLANDKNYQLFQKRTRGEDPSPDTEDDLMDEKEARNKGFGVNDLQLLEAYNVVKDMIYIDAKNRQQDMMIGSERN